MVLRNPSLDDGEIMPSESELLGLNDVQNMMTAQKTLNDGFLEVLNSGRYGSQSMSTLESLPFCMSDPSGFKGKLFRKLLFEHYSV